MLTNWQFYLARPNSGKVEPGGKIRVMSELSFSPFTRRGALTRTHAATAVQKRPLLEEPPLDKDCKHLFNIATAAITVEQEGIEAKDVVSVLPQALERAMPIISVARLSLPRIVVGRSSTKFV